MATAPNPPPHDPVEGKIKIYFLPNLLTAGNLFCGFVALTKIVEADISSGDFGPIKWALFFILLACIFDLFDGRVARMGGVESPFGREFDSLADLISFGAAPAFLVHRVVLRDVFNSPSFYHPELGWFIASIYLLCGAFRLARFNCLAALPGGSGSKDFLGFPIPSAAGLVASLTLLLMKLDENEHALGPLKYILPVVLVFLSMMMVSTVKYPSFKALGLRSTITFPKIIITALIFGFVFIWWQTILFYVLPAFFTLYLVYGFIRPRISHRVRYEIEDNDEDDELDNPSAQG
ncbi:MAG TPA: CDP-diacylglycerol--serine O-phosphatidyltransferase [Verrucomicrobiae bacterium]|jgi:CDP-diacylglycerol--serine O-phosphatidyltransferase|nr:CDP-diacylglycerol--serine O-phosphatidyltransferase [Verrucomicrobiae bacterium]